MILGYIAYIGTDIQFTRLTDKDRRLGLIFLHVYDIPYADLSAYEGIIITNFVEEAFLLENQTILKRYLDQRGVIFSQVENSLPWLPGCGKWVRSPIPIKDREFHYTEPVHQLFQGIDLYDLNYKKGVKGFLTRGYFDRIPLNAEVLLTDQDKQPVLYIDRHTTKGVIIAGAGTALYGYGIQENSTKYLSEQILSYIREKAKKSRKGAKK